MKKNIKYLIIVLALTLPILVLYFALSKKESLTEKKQHRENITLDKLTFFQKDGTIFKFEKKATQNTVLVLFDPDCEICREELKEIVDNYDLFENLNVFFIGPNNKKSYDFLNNKPYELLKKKNAKMLHDNKGVLWKELKIITAPSLLVFGPNAKIKRIYEGAYPLESFH